MNRPGRITHVTLPWLPSVLGSHGAYDVSVHDVCAGHVYNRHVCVYGRPRRQTYCSNISKVSVLGYLTPAGITPEKVLVKKRITKQ